MADTKNGQSWKRAGSELPEAVILKDKGDEIIGKFVETKTIQQEGRDRHIHILIVDGKERALWGSGLLDHLMKDVEKDQTIKVVYLGKKDVEIQGKKRKCNQHEVFIAG